MKESSIILTGDYSKELDKRVTEIEKNVWRNRLKRALMTFLMIAVCAGGILLGISKKDSDMYARYQDLKTAPNRSNLDQELMAYQDVFDFFVTSFLGNYPAQSLMGGYFYTGEACSIRPNAEGQKTLIIKDGSEYVFSDFLADQINVRGDRVIYRDPRSREILSYDFSSGETSYLGICNIGQLVACEDYLYYIDLSSSALMLYSNGTEAITVANDIAAFAVAGNEIIILDREHNLSIFEPESRSETKIAENVTAFSYNGTLWYQFNDKIYRENLTDRRSSEVDLGLDCNRLLGITSSDIIFESNDGVYSCNMEGGTSKKLGEGVFISASDREILWFLFTEQEYQITQK